MMSVDMKFPMEFKKKKMYSENESSNIDHTQPINRTKGTLKKKKKLCPIFLFLVTIKNLTFFL